jgi:hypothetical protein
MYRLGCALPHERAQLLSPTPDETAASAAAASAASAAESAAAFSATGSGGPGSCTALFDEVIGEGAITSVERADVRDRPLGSVAARSVWDMLVARGCFVIQKHTTTTTRSEASRSQPFVAAAIICERVMFTGPHAASVSPMMSPRRRNCKGRFTRSDGPRHSDIDRNGGLSEGHILRSIVRRGYASKQRTDGNGEAPSIIE